MFSSHQWLFEFGADGHSFLAPATVSVRHKCFSSVFPSARVIWIQVLMFVLALVLALVVAVLVGVKRHSYGISVGIAP
jgi:hypothetical protein